MACNLAGVMFSNCGLSTRCIQHENDHLDGITIMQSSEYFYEDTEEGKKAAREAKGNK